MLSPGLIVMCTFPLSMFACREFRRENGNVQWPQAVEGHFPGLWLKFDPARNRLASGGQHVFPALTNRLVSNEIAAER